MSDFYNLCLHTSHLQAATMDALINGGALWWSARLPTSSTSPRRRFRSPESKPSDAVEAEDSALRGSGFNFPLKQAATAASLALAGDAIAQVSGRWKRLQASESDEKVPTFNFLFLKFSLLYWQ